MNSSGIQQRDIRFSARLLVTSGAPFETTAPLPRRGGKFSPSDRRFGRSLLVGLAIVALISCAGPLLSYRSDVMISRSQLQRRVVREASISAQSLSLHLELLQAELERVSQRPEVDLRDDTDVPEQNLLMLAHHDSVLFSGVALFSADGRPIYTEPRNLFPPDRSVLSRRWFQKVLTGESHAVDALQPGTPSFVVALPVMKKHRLTGVIAGVIHSSDPLLPVGMLPGLELVVAGPAGEVLFPKEPPSWAHQPEFARRLQALRGLASMPETSEWTKPQQLATAQPVGRTGLWLVLIADMAPAISSMRERFLLQLAYTGALQLVTLALVSLYLRRTYRRFLEVDLDASQQQTMAALGTAAALIAHEVKNSLNGLYAAASTLAMGGDAAMGVNTVRGQVDRLGHLATSLLSFGNPGPPRIQTVRVDELVQQAVEGLRSHPEREEVQVDVELESPLLAEADPFFLVTAIDNLVRNAIEAGVAAKDLGRQSAPRVEVRARRTNEGVVMWVADNAGGPPPGFEERLFSPFVTSKARGIGLGLAMAHRAVVQQGGSLSFERIAGGSRFTLTLRTTGP